MSATFDPTTMAFGTPTRARHVSAGENNFYPGYSPDGSFVVFNRVPKQTVDDIRSLARPDCTGTGAQVSSARTTASRTAKSRIMLLSTKPGAMPVDAENANGSPAATPVDVSNSWPRWSPFIQTYKGDKLLWVTFSSTRDYGLRVRNHKTGMFQCYPAGQPAADPGGLARRRRSPANCQQPQIWMAAVNLSHLEFNSTDPSFVAFWLPFQDDTKHNHTAQWTQTVAISRRRTWPSASRPAACAPRAARPAAAGGCFGGVCGIP